MNNTKTIGAIIATVFITTLLILRVVRYSNTGSSSVYSERTKESWECAIDTIEGEFKCVFIGEEKFDVERELFSMNSIREFRKVSTHFNVDTVLVTTCFKTSPEEEGVLIKHLMVRIDSGWVRNRR